jgi:hypothetical protein
LKNKVVIFLILSIPTAFTTMTAAKNIYGGLCVPRHDAAIGSCGEEFV